MTKKERAELVIDGLAECYPDVKATRLSAQCTDKRVNMVTPALFEKFPDIDSFAAAEPDEVAEYIHSCGLYKTKAVDIVMMCRMLRDDFGGEIPDTIEELVKLPGVGRKTANLIVGDLYGKPALVCDTHVIRVSGSLTDGTKDALKVEKQLAAIIKPDDRLMMCHRLVWHGRLVCSAAKPNCSECRLSGFCKFFSGTK